MEWQGSSLVPAAGIFCLVVINGMPEKAFLA
jgi:hypothetical protein